MPRALTSVTKWIAGIVAAVATTVLVWYIENRLTPPPPPATITLEGRVVDRSSSKFIHGAQVLLKADTYSADQLTDSEGRYCFLVRPKQLPVVGQLKIEAEGYKSYDLTSTLSQGDNLWEIPLVSSVVTPPAGTNDGHSVPPPPGGLSGSRSSRVPATRECCSGWTSDRIKIRSPGQWQHTGDAFVELA